MAKEVNAGDLRTRIQVYRTERGINANGFNTEQEVAVFSEPVWCKWVWAHGSEVFEHRREKLGQVATITMYHTPLITPQCKIELVDEQAITGTTGELFDVVSIDPVENNRRFMEIKVNREVKA